MEKWMDPSQQLLSSSIKHILRFSLLQKNSKCTKLSKYVVQMACIYNSTHLQWQWGQLTPHTTTRTHPISAASTLIVTDWLPQMIIYLYECPLLACRRSPVPNLSQWSRDRLIKTICRPLCGAKWPDGMLLDPSHASPNTSIIQPGRGDRWTTGTGPGGTWIFSFSFSRCCFDSPHT